MNVLIVEDEYKTAELLKTYVYELRPDYEEAIVIHSVEETIGYLLTHNMPSVIFMDIQLSDGSVFEVFEKVHVTCPIIFCTAYDEYAIDAFKVNGVAYILKPFDRKAVLDALEKVALLSQKEGLAQKLHTLEKLLQETPGSPPAKSLLVFNKQKYVPVEVSQIAFFHIKNELTFIHTFSGQILPLDQSLDRLESKLDRIEFYRVNRQYLVKFQVIKEVEHYFARKLLVTLKIEAPEPIIISKAKASDFMRWLGNH